MKHVGIFLLILSLLPHWLRAQESSQPQGSDQEPFELPEFIIAGKAEIGIPLYQKPLPHPPALLTADEWKQQFYSLEKIPPPPLPQPAFPHLPRLPSIPRGFAQLGIGLFPTISLRTLYRWERQHWLLQPQVRFEHSRGHQPNADYTFLNFDLLAQYQLPFPFPQFPQSYRSTLRFHLYRYRLYALDSAPQRLAAAVHFSHAWKNHWFSLPYTITTAVRWFRLHQAAGRQEWLSRFQIQLDSVPPLLLPISLNADLQWGNSFGHSIGIGTFQLTHQRQLFPSLQFHAALGMQFGRAQNVQGIYPLLSTALSYQPSPLWSLECNLNWRLQSEWQWEWWQKNPYIAVTSATTLTHPLQLSLQSWYHPTTSLSLLLKTTLWMGKLGTWQSTPLQGTFIRQYVQATLLRTQLLWYWQPLHNVLWNGSIEWNWSQPQAAPDKLPFIPTFFGETQLQYRWSSLFQSSITLSVRSALPTDTDTLPAYAMLSLASQYQFADPWLIVATIHNLFDAPLYEWNNYRKRGLYAELLLRYRIK